MRRPIVDIVLSVCELLLFVAGLATLLAAAGYKL